MPIALALYRGISHLARPAIEASLRRRLASGREDASRLMERKGRASIDRPDGPLIWVHAASVGEANSSIRMIERFLSLDENLHVLLTTGTVTSAGMLAGRLPARAIHQYCPLDYVPWIVCFLDHWKPRAAVWIESELWPNTIVETAGRGIPLALVNARMSARSERNWRFGGSAIRALLARFSLCLAQTPDEASRFSRLGARSARYVGNLKYSAPPPPAGASELRALSTAVGGRRLWLAASTHPGDEELALAVHHRLVKKHPDLLTVIALRHPHRRDNVLRQIRDAGLSVACRVEAGKPSPENAVFLIDTIGEMGLFYRLAPIVLICGTFSDRGGHNPIEPAQLDCGILHGPDMRNFAIVAEELRQAGGARRVGTVTEITDTVAELMENPEQLRSLAGAASQVAESNMGVVDRVMEQLNGLVAGGGKCSAA